MFSPLDNEPKKALNSTTKYARSQGGQTKSPQPARASQNDDTAEQQDERNPIKNLFNEILDHEKNIQQLQIIDSIKRGIHNSNRQRKMNIDIE